MHIKLEHLSSPNGCHEDCPACKADSGQPTAISKSQPAPADLFAAIVSLNDECMRLHRLPEHPHITNLPHASYEDGGIGFMQAMYQVAEKFCLWADENVDWDQNSEVWPYFLQEKLGTAVFAVVDASELMTFGEAECRRVATRLGVSIKDPAPAGSIPQT